MNCLRGMNVAVWGFVAVFIVASAHAEGFNPQPEPPGMWYTEGYIDMWAMEVDLTGEAIPFGIDQDIVGDAMVDFSAGVIARFNAPTTADDKPADGLYDVEFEYFMLQIGDTIWDQTMPGTMQFQVTDGVVNDCYVRLTDTIPAHPDLLFALSASPAKWEALDEREGRDVVNLGIVTGTYSLRDGVVPEPSALVLLALGAISLAWCRRLI